MILQPCNYLIKKTFSLCNGETEEYYVCENGYIPHYAGKDNQGRLYWENARPEEICENKKQQILAACNDDITKQKVQKILTDNELITNECIKSQIRLLNQRIQINVMYVLNPLHFSCHYINYANEKYSKLQISKCYPSPASISDDIRGIDIIDNNHDNTVVASMDANVYHSLDLIEDDDLVCFKNKIKLKEIVRLALDYISDPNKNEYYYKPFEKEDWVASLKHLRANN